MACGFGLFTDRLCALAVIIVPWVAVPNAPTALFRFSRPKVGSLSALVYEMLRQPQKMPVSGKAVQPQECKLYLRVSRDTLMLLSDKTVVYTFSIFYRNVRQTALARCFIVGTGGFDKVPRTVQLMALKQICPALFRVLYGKVRVQIAVLVLCIGDDADKLISLLFKLLIGLVGNGISRSFKPLVSVAVLKDHSVKAVADVLSSESLCGIDKVRRYVAFFHSLKLVPQHAVLIWDNFGMDDILIFFHKSRGLV